MYIDRPAICIDIIYFSWELARFSSPPLFKASPTWMTFEGYLNTYAPVYPVLEY